jgi:hypothetical protein
MEWKGEKLITVKDFLIKGINRCQSPYEAREFMRIYRSINPNADKNMEFMCEYYSSQESKRIHNWFDINQSPQNYEKLPV